MNFFLNLFLFWLLNIIQTKTNDNITLTALIGYQSFFIQYIKTNVIIFHKKKKGFYNILVCFRFVFNKIFEFL